MQNRLIHPCDVPTGLLNNLLFILDNQEMSISDLRKLLNEADYRDKAITTIKKINNTKVIA